MPVLDEEVGRVGPNFPVLVERRLDLLGARRIGAFADELGVVDEPVLGSRGNVLVDRPEERLGPCAASICLCLVTIENNTSAPIELRRHPSPRPGRSPSSGSAAALREAGAEARVEQFADGAHTAEEPPAPSAASCPGSSSRCSSTATGTPVLVLVPGDRRADRPRSRRRSAPRQRPRGERRPGRKATGFPPGGVSPFALARVERVLIDNNLLVAAASLWVGAGSTTHMAGLPASELVRVARAEPADVVIDDVKCRTEGDMQETEKIWMNGELVDWADARIHVGAHGLHYGTGVFEGIRCYATERGPAVFRLTDHLSGSMNSARLLYMELPYSVEELRAACFETIGVNGLEESYLRPIAFYGYGELGVHTGTTRSTSRSCASRGAPISARRVRARVRAMISSWRRVGPNTIPHAAKATGVYLNSMLATHEARRAGTTRRSC